MAKTPEKLLLRCWLAPGDVLMTTILAREIKKKYPEIQLRVNTCADEIFKNNPYIDEDQSSPQCYDTASEVPGERYKAEDDGWLDTRANYGDEPQHDTVLDNKWSIHKCSTTKKHYAFGMLGYMNALFNWALDTDNTRPDIFLSEEEKKPLEGLPEKYWVIIVGGKDDYPRKIYPERRWRKLIELNPDKNFAQIGITAKGHIHPLLNYPNVVNLIDKTTLRETFTLIHNSTGVIGPITYTHLAAVALNKPSIVLAGGGEHHTWQAYPKEHYLHTCGVVFDYERLPEYVKKEVTKEKIHKPNCCRSGGCWGGHCSNIMPDGEQLCMKFITPEKISEIMRRY